MFFYLRPTVLLLPLLLFGCGLVPNPSNVKISKVPANGVTNSSFDQAYLQQLIETTRKAAEQQLIKTYERNNIPPSERISHAMTSGQYEQRGKRRLAIIELTYSDNPMKVTRVVGIENDQIVTISCISPQGAPVDPFAATGECAESVRQQLP
ncbi:MAG: hypothetical protein PVJ68_05440 [Candidatus Thiodiazotropha sp.]|jgi:hypothetical protein